MPTFTEPRFLLLLLLVPPLMWWRLRQRRSALRHPGTGLFAGLPVGRGRIAHWGGAGLRAAALVALVLALSGPRWPDYRTRIPTEGIAIAMVVDVSGSMAELDFDWQGKPISRLDAVKRVFELFIAGGDRPDGERLEGRPTDLVGLVAFATRPEIPSPLTLSHSVLLETLKKQMPKEVPGTAETNISDALVLGWRLLDSAGPRRKVMILLSDGEHNVPQPRSQWTPFEAARKLADLGIRIHTIDAGGEVTTIREPGARNDTLASRAAGAQALREIAQLTRGESFQANNTQALLKVCQEIDRLERQEIKSFQYRRYFEGYPWLALTAFVLLVAVQLLEMTVWLKVP
jgi:Ca-activated chloride channel family protein